MPEYADFNAIRISLASPENIRTWSYGVVTKPETINYRTLRPEKDGLFCEKIFGPTRDWECSCGKYKKIRYRGVKCDRCGVEVTRAKVRRERMGHIALAAPVTHIWFAKGIPSRLALLLDLSPRNLERVVYFAQYIVTEVNEVARQEHLSQLRQLLEKLEEDSEKRIQERVSELHDTEEQQEELSDGDSEADSAAKRESAIRVEMGRERAQTEEDLQNRIDDLEDIRPRQLLAENRNRELKSQFGDVYKSGMGAEAILRLLQQVDLEDDREALQNEVHTTSGQRRKKAIKRLRIVEAFRKSGNKPEWMVLDVLPVLPPDLRPMVQLDGGRFATSDLNDLYRRVINRNNRLKRLLDLGAPEIIVRNEKRMLQEAVDALIDNGRRGRAIAGTHKHKLKSLADLLRGKQGRFRQNLLGKRVDYSGRTVIVVGPELRLHQCGLPKRMALELFKPLVMNRLVELGHSHNIKSAKRMVERVRPEVWDILEEVIQDHPVLLNRAPTLHRLGIQAFQPVLIEGNAIQIHPLVCTAFNADFDGDQMAVHVPLARKALLEAKKVMLSTYNMLSPSSGEPIVTPTLDMVLGCFYLTMIRPNSSGEGQHFRNLEDARLAYDLEQIALQAEILIKDDTEADGWLKTTAGRIIFNEVLPEELGYQNIVMDKQGLKEVVAASYRTLGNDGTADVLDRIKRLGFQYATKSGITIAITDIEVVPKKREILDEATKRVEQLDQMYQGGLITEEERYGSAISIWREVSDRVQDGVKEFLSSYAGIYMMATSGAKGNIAQITQMAGMRGLMSNPRGQIIELPVKSSFREGLSVLEYFISTHGARKGLTDTALRTADSGYLTRRLIDVAQDVIILEEDCGSPAGIWIEEQTTGLLASFEERILGRTTASPVIDPSDDKRIIANYNVEIDEQLAKQIAGSGIGRIMVRSALDCQATRGMCQACYGRSLATGARVMPGEAVGIIAAQSIGEPGTQLTMRTFHTGGVAQEDITSGLPRVEELFEARSPRGQAILAEIDGEVDLSEGEDGRRIRLVSSEEYQEEITLPRGYEGLVSEGDWVDVGTPLAQKKTRKKATKNSNTNNTEVAESDLVFAEVAGRIHLNKKNLVIVWEESDEREYVIPPVSYLIVGNGQKLRAGDALTAGSKSPQDILRIQGKDAVQRYMVEQVQQVYRSQGVTINDKHIEVIVRQMLRKVRIDSTGDTGLLPGELVDRLMFEGHNSTILAEGGEPATAQPVLLGVTRASLNTESFLAAASFQETARVLTDAAVNGSIDRLQGLKENVIIGRLIPARFDGSEEGRRRLGVGEFSDQQEQELEERGELFLEPEENSHEVLDEVSSALSES